MDSSTSEQQQQQQQQQGGNKAPNSSLTKEEKEHKRNLKKRLKQQHKLRKLEVRLQQAIKRKDDVWIERATQELDAFRQELNDDLQQPHDTSATNAQHLKYIVAIYQALQLPATAVHEESRELLFNMSKGTQTQNMFDNADALVGYTRQKFVERAMLTATSLQKARGIDATRCICSIGCGPGCDAVGALAHFGDGRVDEIILLDYVIGRWKDAVLERLEPVLMDKQVAKVTMGYCDIRRSLMSRQDDPSETNDGAQISSDSNRDTNDATWIASHADLILISYVITETRGKWKNFFLELTQCVEPGTRILLSEPTAWQLHEFLNVCGEHLSSHEWLDSSQMHPELQPLEGRIGPAVLMVCVGAS